MTAPGSSWKLEFVLPLLAPLTGVAVPLDVVVLHDSQPPDDNPQPPSAQTPVEQAPPEQPPQPKQDFRPRQHDFRKEHESGAMH
jgi:hypothetical protein